MKKIIYFLIGLLPVLIFSQDNSDWKKGSFTITPEILVGYTAPSNIYFPEMGLQKQFILNLGRNHSKNPQEWAQRYDGPETGVSFGVSDFGNLDSLGIAITVMPYVAFKSFGSNRFTTNIGLGASYFNKKYDPITNPNNRAVTTDVTWAFRAYLHYNFLKTKRIDLRLGLGYSHHSNGHTKLDNQGYNSFLLGLSAALHAAENEPIENEPSALQFKKSAYDYWSLRYGQGFNVFGYAFNKNKPVYTIEMEYGKVYNNNFKLGVGVFYRLYQHYYDYIQQNESLVQDGREFASFKENPFYNASNLAVYVNGEFLLNHFGIDLKIGYNIFKPGYKIDWRINAGWIQTPQEIPETWMLGAFNSKYKFKQAINTRMGLKYYLIGTSKKPRQNIFIGAHLNANMGQADFTEFSIGYVQSFGF